jgi:serine/threonine protein kinase
MARKKITAKTQRGRQNFETERKNLQHFKECLLNHANIMQSFASFVHGPDFVILSPWADGRDLHKFLYSPQEVFRNYPEQSTRFTPNNIFMEIYSLGQALDFLHNHMGMNNGRKLTCAHLDLKPENILVCFNSTGSTPVGRWKIGDFGLSNVEESVARGELVQVPPAQEHAAGLAPGNILRDVSVRPLRRGPGPFQPPEVKNEQTAKVSTRRDVWSFGCILAMVLAFTIGGAEEVNRQLQWRAKGTDDYFYRRLRRLDDTNHRQYSDGTRPDSEIKPAIKQWLERETLRLAPDVHHDWIGGCSKLILRLLNVNVIERPDIGVAVSELSRILEWTMQCGKDRIWGFDGASVAPEVVASDIPEVNVGRSSMDSTSQPFIGLPSNSSPASSPATSNINPSSSKGSPSVFFKRDGTLSFVRLETPKKSEGANLSLSAKVATMWSKSEVYIYDLEFLGDHQGHWSERPKCGEQEKAHLGASFSEDIKIPESARCLKVLLAGTFAAVEQQQGNSTSVCIHTDGLSW